jgi:hypothetical protein
MAMALACIPFYLVREACPPIVAILLVYVSILTCCSVLCIFENHMLAFIDLIHALPTRGSIASNEEKYGKMHFSGGACIHAFGNSFRLDFSCALLPMVSSPFVSP